MSYFTTYNEQYKKSDQQPKWISTRYLFRRVSLCLKLRRSYVALFSIVFLTIILLWNIFATKIDVHFPKNYGFHPLWHPPTRSERFPSVEDRLKLYMSNWYIPACADEQILYEYVTEENEDGKGKTRSVHLFSNNESNFVSSPTRIRMEQIVAVTTHGLDSMEEGDKAYIPSSRELLRYAKDVDKKRISVEDEYESFPVLTVFGDLMNTDFRRHKIPYFSKTRYAALSPEEIDDTTSSAGVKECQSSRHALLTTDTENDSVTIYSPIIWLVKYERHFGSLEQVKKEDIPWHDKKPMAVSRNLPTGDANNFYEIYNLRPSDPFHEKCAFMQRCQLVSKYLNSSLADVGFASELPGFKIPVDSFKKGRMSLKAQLEYKALISLEGNDVSSGLKWMLYSRSVVIMPRPTKESYAMESLLVPWVHYIPIKADLSDLEEQILWMQQNDEKAQKIAERATLFIHDLIYHKDAAGDRSKIEREMMKRYKTFFRRRK